MSATWIVASILSMPAVMASVNCLRVMAGSSETSSPAKARRAASSSVSAIFAASTAPASLWPSRWATIEIILRDALGVAGFALGVAQLASHLGGVEPVDAVPGGEVDEGRRGQRAFAVGGRGLVAELGITVLSESCRSKSVPPTWTPPVARMSAERSAARARSGETRTIEKSEVPPPRSTMSAELLARDLLLVVERRGDRLVLEGDVAEALRADRALELLLRLAVGDRIVVDEVHGAADDDDVRARRRASASARRFSSPTKVPTISRKGMMLRLMRTASPISELPRMLLSERIIRPSTPPM